MLFNSLTVPHFSSVALCSGTVFAPRMETWFPTPLLCVSVFYSRLPPVLNFILQTVDSSGYTAWSLVFYFQHRSGWPGVSILWLSEIANLIHLSVSVCLSR